MSNLQKAIEQLEFGTMEKAEDYLFLAKQDNEIGALLYRAALDDIESGEPALAVERLKTKDAPAQKQEQAPRRGQKKQH